MKRAIKLRNTDNCTIVEEERPPLLVPGWRAEDDRAEAAGISRWTVGLEILIDPAFLIQLVSSFSSVPVPAAPLRSPQIDRNPAEQAVPAPIQSPYAGGRSRFPSPISIRQRRRRGRRRRRRHRKRDRGAAQESGAAHQTNQEPDRHTRLELS